MKKAIRFIAGIITGCAGTQALLFWIGAEGTFVQLALSIILLCASMWCFTNEQEETPLQNQEKQPITKAATGPETYGETRKRT